MPQRPDVGFFGRDETLYALDRAFDEHKIVLLHAFAGSGKTTTAAEFARWYALTGGIKGPVLFTSFERHLPLARALDKIGEIFGPDLEQRGVQWGAKSDAQRRQIALLDVLQQVPVLWIWDNVEPIAGFPAGAQSDWSAAEQQELRDFLAAVRDTKAKFLLTSRRDEAAWLGKMPWRVQAPPMPMQERLQLAGEIVKHRLKRLADLPDLTPLLRFTQGNPLTILVTVGEALRAGIDSKERLEAFVAALQGGTADFKVEETEGRTKSLGASLSYGFGSAFNDDERKILALLHLFQGFVDVSTFLLMVDKDAEWRLEEVRGLSREQGMRLFDRAADIGLLVAHGGGYYGVHPALPWYFRALFERHFAGEQGDRARRAFVEGMGELGNYYADELIRHGNLAALSLLAWEEDNLLAAWRLARQHGWWHRVISAMQGLRLLYHETGRNPAWRRLVEAIAPEFVDPKTDLPLAGREEDWGLFTEYRVALARQERDFAKGENLQRVLVDWHRKRARPSLETAPDQRSDLQRQAIRNLGVSVHQLGVLQGEKGDAACAEPYREAFKLAQAIGDAAMQARSAFNLGVAYTDVTALRDYDAAERWLQQSLNLRPPRDASGRGSTLVGLGTLSMLRFDDALVKRRPPAECRRLLDAAARYCLQALQTFPPTAVVNLGVTYSRLGAIYNRAGDIDCALQNYEQAIWALLKTP